jgi:thiaminase/transcriptional activator TenA
MTERFTEILRQASQPAWSQSVGHRFVTELLAGTVSDAVMVRYPSSRITASSTAS